MQKFLSYLLIAFLLLGCSIKPVLIKEVSSANVVSVQNGKAVVQVNMRIENPNWFRIKVKSADLNGQINNSQIGVIGFPNKLVIKGNEDKTYPLLFDISLANIVPLLPSLMFSESVTLGLKGNFKAKAFIISKRIPLDVKKSISTRELKPF